LGAERIVRRPASDTEKRKLELKGRADVIEIQRTRLVDGSPRIAEKIILPHRLFPGIEKQMQLPNTLYSLYQEGFGISIAIAKEELRAVLANKKDALALGLKAGAPLLQVDRIAVALDGQPVEWRISRCDTRDIVYAVEVS
jgi:GntR family transcriptional regulator